MIEKFAEYRTDCYSAFNVKCHVPSRVTWQWSVRVTNIFGNERQPDFVLEQLREELL